MQHVRDVSDKMRLYLEEEKTVAVLLPPLLVSFKEPDFEPQQADRLRHSSQDEIVETYTTFFNRSSSSSLPRDIALAHALNKLTLLYTTQSLDPNMVSRQAHHSLLLPMSR